MRSQRPARRRGFTLMEVLLVLAILVILGSIVVVNFSGVFEGSKAKAARTQVAAFEQMLDTYYLDVGSYPSTSQGLEALRQAPSDLRNAQKWNGPYASKEIPVDPWGNPYQYELVSPAEFRVWSVGADGQDGTDDDVSNTSS